MIALEVTIVPHWDLRGARGLRGTDVEPGMLQIDRIRHTLRTRRIGRRIEYFSSCPSTNDEAWARIEAGDVDGLVVLAEHQSAGRGRFGRTWESPRGASLLCSVALIEESRERSGGELALIAVVAAHSAITSCTDVVPTIKWPNDLLVGGRKLGGILIESRVLHGDVPAYVVGMGLNCLQHEGHLSSDLCQSATSLELESHQAINRTALAASLLSQLDRWLANPRSWSYTDLRSEWLARAEPVGTRVQLEQAGRIFSGSIIDVDPTAALVVRLDEGGVRAFNAANTTIVHQRSVGDR